MGTHTPTKFWLLCPLQSSWDISLTRRKKKKRQKRKEEGRKEGRKYVSYCCIAIFPGSSTPVSEKVSSLASASSRTGIPCSLLVFCINEHALLFLSFLATFQLIHLSLGSNFWSVLPRDMSCLFKCCLAHRLQKQIRCFQPDLLISQHHCNTYSHTRGRNTDTTLKTSKETIFLSIFLHLHVVLSIHIVHSKLNQGLQNPCENSHFFSMLFWLICWA